MASRRDGILECIREILTSLIVGIQSRAWSSYAQSNPYGVPLNDDLPSDLAMVQEACTAKVSECRDTVHDDHVASIEDTQTCIEAEYCIANLLAQYTPTGVSHPLTNRATRLMTDLQ